MLWDAVMDALRDGCQEVQASVEATFSWYFRDEDQWLTVESRSGTVMIRPGLTEQAEMKFYSASVADFIHQHSTEGAGRAIFQGGGFYWRGNMDRLKVISPLCRTLFGVRLHQRLTGAGIQVPKFEARRYPARTKAQRDRILAEWVLHGERRGAVAVVADPSAPEEAAESPAVTPVLGAPKPHSRKRAAAPAGTPGASVGRAAPALSRGVKSKATPRSARTLRKT